MASASYVLVHNILELFSVLVSLSIFSVGWFTFHQSRDRYALFLGAAFLAIGLLDFMHTLANVAMPAFVTENSSNKSTQYWIAARLLQGGALLASAFIHPKSQGRWLSRSALLAPALLIPALVFAGVTFFPEAMPATFIPGSGLTPFKKTAEYLVIALLCLAAAGYWRRMSRSGDRLLLYCLAALVVSIASEVCLAAYTRVFDTYNVLGHVYKALAFLFIYRWIFIASVTHPYVRLAEGEHARHLASFPQLNPNPVLEVSRSGEITFFNPAAEKTVLSLGLDRKDVNLFLPPDIATVLRDLEQKVESTRHSEVTIRDRVLSRTLHIIPRFGVLRIYADDITERKLAEEAVRRLNEELRRNLDLLAGKNRELEAFTYSVSHDVRAPLRAMTVFSTLLLQQYASGFDERARSHLDRVCRAAADMNRIIDDLLRLSRISLLELQREKVDLSAMLLFIAAELREECPDRPFVLSCDAGITAFADAGLLQVALANLLRNAWKFTSKQQDASIEFGSFDDRGKTVYYLKDNGVGFDQRFAERLFLPFQRLHSQQEFEGTGIGLATVDRVIRRHGGTIWAEGTVNGGATFSFTLG